MESGLLKSESFSGILKAGANTQISGEVIVALTEMDMMRPVWSRDFKPRKASFYWNEMLDSFGRVQNYEWDLPEEMRLAFVEISSGDFSISETNLHKASIVLRIHSRQRTFLPDDFFETNSWITNHEAMLGHLVGCNISSKISQECFGALASESKVKTHSIIVGFLRNAVVRDAFLNTRVFEQYSPMILRSLFGKPNPDSSWSISKFSIVARFKMGKIMFSNMKLLMQVRQYGQSD